MAEGRATICPGFRRPFPIKIPKLFIEATRSLMAQISKVCGFVAAMALAAVPYASAQAPSPSASKFFASVNFGGQLASRTLDVSASQTVYDETATLEASLPIGKGFVPD